MSERSILAYFKSPEEAEGVARKLRALRAIEISIDRFSRYGGTSFSSGVNPVTGNVARMDSLTAERAHTGILAAADTSASGMSHGGDGGPTGRDILLTVILHSESYDQALRLIEEAGGMI
ncbi:hypothetical protein R50345_23535 [Paenibacillus sp. FSL R5-0345]|uniref:Uncharacterized protein n=1 Tax=Paenibacillus odorifer TaxID=189426 RepID=A0A1R0Y8G4_9BACL|nr:MULTISPECIES: hypothetical protein [Paenibacillus]AIQ37343.1 hypothetical protein R50345_23535 [Paenibacillus sp. FSL R5-0345]OMD43642.1 hypothetical protein BSK52_04405 [Paenibacillus odorifer]